ncbi:hypothetical protein DPM19_26995 [Actinomadura craniellae]|uniref:Uncharacterized protein n=1 Tax=Actinomadura craniellae TaxID=2231787 RepID=A0A365GZ01_9ACTN|nr:hypothetical protein [Actinomadura craniellae]RAY11998.1 hypothetical protein DPM19_26995 [Actinomadura craniellae]
MEYTAQHVAQQLTELTAEFAGWRIGRGGSGNWWAVRGNEIIRTGSADELRARLGEISTAQPAGAVL